MPENERTDHGESEHLLAETQRVLNRQVNIVQNQQQQASKILRVLLTVTGLLLTTTSIVATLMTNGGLERLGVESIRGIVPELTFTSAATGIVTFYVATIFLSTIGLMFVSAFRVLSPETTSTSLSILEHVLNIPYIGYRIGRLFEMYFKILPISIDPFESLLNRDQISLRSGVDGEKAMELSDGVENIVQELSEYNSGCIEKNEKLIEQNRKLLSTIYSTAILFTVLTVCIILFIIVVLTIQPSS